MNPTLVTFIGFVVALLIIVWAVSELTRRYTRQKNVNAKILDAWVTLKPNTTNSIEEVILEHDDEQNEGVTDSVLHKRAKQNGHYSQSKKPL